MIVINNAVYVRSPKGYIKCILHRKSMNGHTVYFLVETKVSVDALPENYDVLTLPEIIAKYAADAVDDDDDIGAARG